MQPIPAPRPLTLLLLAVACLASAAEARNLQLIEQLPNGFAIYRSGRPDAADVAEMRELGIGQMCVLAGNAADYELRHRREHPDLEIVYDVKQDEAIPPDDEFLDWFDGWVESARAEGRKIAFRCNCGCHRTGRLAAYYQMKWMNLTRQDALVLMHKYGRQMWKYKQLEKQVEALEERIRRQRREAG